MIRQVITCNICGSQKRQTNHWFVAYQETGELRISGWNSLRLLSPETKHLCGEACAHKLISQFLMRSVDLEHKGLQTRVRLRRPRTRTSVRQQGAPSLRPRRGKVRRVGQIRPDLPIMHVGNSNARSDRTRAPEGEHHDKGQSPPNFTHTALSACGLSAGTLVTRLRADGSSGTNRIPVVLTSVSGEHR